MRQSTDHETDLIAGPDIDRYLVWIPGETGKGGKFQCPAKRVIQRQGES